VLDKYPQDVKLVFKNFPLSSHRFARQAAVAALAAHRQARFWEFHHLLFENQETLNDMKIQEIASTIGLDLQRFNRDMRDASLLNLVTRDMRDGRRAGVKSVPRVFINGKLLINRSLEGIEQMIERELK
jgi:protein-disulfide isomerase